MLLSRANFKRRYAKYVRFSAVLPLCATLSKLVACCGREIHSLLGSLLDIMHSLNVNALIGLNSI